MSCTPVLGVKENYDRHMPLFDRNGIREAFKKVVGGMPKLINLYDPDHVEALLPQLKEFVWNITSDGDALEAKIKKNSGAYTKIVYRPLSIQAFKERVLLWDGNFYTGADVADANFAKKATKNHLLFTTNKLVKQEQRLIVELLS